MFFNSRFHKHLCYVEELPKTNKMLGIYNFVTKKKSAFHVPDFNISLKTMSSPWHWISSIESYDFKSIFVFDTLIDFYGNGVLINTTFCPNATGFHAARVADLEICEILNNQGLIIIAPRRGVRKSQTTRTDWDLDGGAFQFPLSLSLSFIVTNHNISTEATCDWQPLTFQTLLCWEKHWFKSVVVSQAGMTRKKKIFFFFYCFSPICWIHGECFFSLSSCNCGRSREMTLTNRKLRLLLKRT